MNYTKQAQEVLKTAKMIAKQLDHPYIGTEHLLLGLRKVYTGVAAQVLAMNHVKEEDIYRVVDELVSPVGEKENGIKLENSPRMDYILRESQNEALRFKAEKIGSEHMLLAMLKDVECVGARILLTLNINLQKIYQDILSVLGADPREYAESMQEDARKGGVLEQYTTDLTVQAQEGKLDPIIGREEEIQRLMQILCRRTKNNPCLTGEPGSRENSHHRGACHEDRGWNCARGNERQTDKNAGSVRHDRWIKVQR